MSVQWSGLEEFRAAMANLPQHLAGEAAGLVKDATEGAATDIRAAYPEGPTGNLRKRVKTVYPSPLVGQVKSQAPHAHLYEFGTQSRKTRAGANRGKGGPHPTTVPIARRHRREMEAKLIDLVKANAFEVSGG